jgi:hypothetical protein
MHEVSTERTFSAMIVHQIGLARRDMMLIIQIFGLSVLGGLLFAFLRQDAGLWDAGQLRTRGTVISHTSVQADDGDDLFKARVRFTDAQGTVREIDDWCAFSYPFPEVGASVDVDYSPADSAIARVRHARIRTFFYISIVGAMTLIAAMMAGLFQ